MILAPSGKGRASLISSAPARRFFGRVQHLSEVQQLWYCVGAYITRPVPSWVGVVKPSQLSTSAIELIIFAGFLQSFGNLSSISSLGHTCCSRFATFVTPTSGVSRQLSPSSLGKHVLSIFAVYWLTLLVFRELRYGLQHSTPPSSYP